MKTEKQRLAIAEFSGWELRNETEVAMHWPGGMLPTTVKRWFKKEDRLGIAPHDELPDYPNDLNALMDVCRLLAKDGWRFSVKTSHGGRYVCYFTKGDNEHYAIATTLAEAMSEAILRVIGKWEEE